MVWEAFRTVLFSFIATMGFGVLLHAPKKALMAASAIGAFGYLVYWVLAQVGIMPQAAMFLAAVVASMLAEGAARRMGMAVTVFSTLSVIPLLPGLALYQCMALLGQGKGSQGLQVGLDAMILILMIALGLGMGTFIFQAFRLQRWVKVKK